MAEVDPKVMQFVEDALKKNPKEELEDLFEQAKKVSSSVAKLTKRQFNARYPLQVKRRAAQGKPPRKKPSRRAAKSGSSKKSRKKSTSRAKSTTDASRDNVRNVLLQFATDIAGAQERKDLVKVLANVDRYVDRVMKGVS